MSTSRNSVSAATLGNGEVLVVGGIVSPGTVTTSAETYDPQTNTWSATNSGLARRYDYGMVSLNDGSVLVVGGCCEAVRPYGLSTAEKFVPLAGCPADVTARVAILSSPIVVFFVPELRLQLVLVYNRTAQSIAGPLAFVVNNQNALLLNGAGITACVPPPGGQYAVVHPGADDVLSPGELVPLFLLFLQTAAEPVTYTPRLLSGIPAL
jgi:hypothetical protein